MYVLMVVPSDFPNGDAGAVRDEAFALIYKELGYDVHLVGKSTKNKSGNYNGTDYVSIYKNTPCICGQLERFLFEHKDYQRVVDEWINQYGSPSVIHINSIPEKSIDYLITLADEYSIPIVHDSVEWYSACEFPKGKLDKAYILKDRLNRKVIREPVRVYSISSYLNDHFKGRGLKSCRIPVIMDVLGTTVGYETGSDKVKLIYAGNPATKDYLIEMVLGVEMLSEADKNKIEFNILGATDEQIKDITGLSELSSCLKAHGRVPRQTVQEELLKSDFSVLLRPADERYARAGFPTKSVEAMAHGVAMLCNLSSDLGMYLSDMKNSVIVEGYTSERFSAAVKKVLSLDRKQIDDIKRQARMTAEINFDYRLWKHTVKTLIEE